MLVDYERSFDLDPFLLSVPVAVESLVIWIDATAVAVDELHPGLVTSTVLSTNDFGLEQCRSALRPGSQ